MVTDQLSLKKYRAHCGSIQRPAKSPRDGSLQAALLITRCGLVLRSRSMKTRRFAHMKNASAPRLLDIAAVCALAVLALAPVGCTSRSNSQNDQEIRQKSAEA